MKAKKDVTFRVKSKVKGEMTYYRPERLYNFLGIIKVWIPFEVYMSTGTVMIAHDSWKDSKYYTEMDIENYCRLKNYKLIWDNK